MADEEGIKISVGGLKESFGKVQKLLNDRKVQWAIIVVLLLAIVIFGSWVRVQNLPLLKDSTTGKYIPGALDPFYWLRMAQTIVQTGGLPAVDNLRIISGGIGFSHEILPSVVAWMYKFSSLFSNVSLQYIDVIYPVVFFVLGIIAFFVLVYLLTNSKTIALTSSFLLSIMPPYLYRSSAGFSDHDILGMFAFFLVLIGYILALKFLEKEKIGRKALINSALFGLLVGFFSVFTIASWGGISYFIFMILPASFILFWLIKTRELKENSGYLLNFVLFYSIFFVSSILFGLIYGFSLKSMIGFVFLSPTSLINGVALLFMVSDLAIIKFKHRINFIKKENLEKYRAFYSLILSVVLGLAFLIIIGQNLVSFFQGFIDRILNPFGAGRVGLTVAENAIPYLNDWINQIGPRCFWLFFAGIIFVGFEISKCMDKKKNKILFSVFWILMVSGILFSRLSASSLFDGTNFISRLFYIGSVILFLGYLVFLYFSDRIKVRPELLLIFSWMFLMLIAVRGAVRLLFMITPFAAFMIGFFIVNLFGYIKKSKDELFRIFLILIFILSIVGILFSSMNFISSDIQQTQVSGPSAGYQWQHAMSWVRENTPTNSIFVHWWDYGYWVEYLGERATIADGGHFEGSFRDHLIGRYLLTTPNPATALSFMKSNNISYLLIDPTDLGKYGAYSIIGSDNSGTDRYASIPVMTYDSAQSSTSPNNATTTVYQGGSVLYDDITYTLNGNQIFLPSGKAGLGAIVITSTRNSGGISFSQPEGIFLYNSQQIKIPLRYVYFNNQIIDFGSGIDSVVDIIPQVSQTNNQISINRLGAAIYLSPKVSQSLFAQLYLLDDAFGNYPSVSIAHSEPDPYVAQLNSQGANLGDFAYFNGFRGPIKIWKVDYPSNIVTNDEFLRTSGSYAEFDNLTFTK